MRWELWCLVKQRSILLLVLLSMCLSFLCLHNGWQHMTHIARQIEHAQVEAARHQQAYLQAHAQSGALEAGEVAYYLFHPVFYQPAEWGFIALGNRIVVPYVQRIRLLGLQGQLYDGESHHPEYVMLGSFDYAFWLVFFAPLCCIALLHDLKASEHQAHRLFFLNSLLKHPWQFWLSRIGARSLLIATTFILPLIVFAVWYQLSSKVLCQVVGLSALYILAWTGICCTVALGSKALNASLNALILTSIWLFLCIALPNLAQLWLHQHPVVEDGSQIAMQHRQWVHRAWDLPKETTMTPFYARYPQWRNSPPVTGRFHWKWYYAFQQMADLKLSSQVTSREHALQQREHTTQQLSYVLPGLWLQRHLEDIAQSNVTHLLKHRQRISNFHSQLRHAFYPFLFEERPFTVDDFNHLPQFAATTAQSMKPID